MILSRDCPDISTCRAQIYVLKLIMLMQCKFIQNKIQTKIVSHEKVAILHNYRHNINNCRS